MPADESLRRIGWRVWRYFEKEEKDPFIAAKSLKWAHRKKLDSIAAPPACAPITAEMQQTFAEWSEEEEPQRWLHLVILPPSDRNNVMQTWASQHGHEILKPPSRESLLDPEADIVFPDWNERSLIVIPRLERWFLRHRNGLSHVRRLLNYLAIHRRRCVIGCNSWAWQFLAKSIHAGRLLPSGLVPNAFDADRLQTWLMELAAEEGHADHVFRLAEKGSVVDSNYFAKLAARSLGIPWVAWQLWRRALRLGPSGSQRSQQKFPDERTIWVSDVEVFHVPRDETSPALFALHALLIHDRLTASELDTVVPAVNASQILPSLVEAELVELHNGEYSSIPAAYPTIRSRLVDAGFPKDRL